MLMAQGSRILNSENMQVLWSGSRAAQGSSTRSTRSAPSLCKSEMVVLNACDSHAMFARMAYRG
jgi:hypothetical protein